MKQIPMIRHEAVNKTYDVNERIRKKLVIVGDGATGKTALLMVQAKLPFPEAYMPTIFENYYSKIPIKKQMVELSMWDTAGQEDYDRLRPLSYPDTDIIVITFAVNDMESFWNVKDRWHNETRHFLPNVPVIVVGTKVDLRPENVEEVKGFVSQQMGEEIAKEIGACGYMEVSAYKDIGVKELFVKSAQLSLKSRKRSRRAKGDNCKVL